MKPIRQRAFKRHLITNLVLFVPFILIFRADQRPFKNEESEYAGPSQISVYGRSLEPVVHNGESVVLDSTSDAIQKITRGDYIVFFDQRDRKLAKRVVAVGGDLLSFSGDHLYVNGRIIANSAGQDYVLTSPVIQAIAELRPLIASDELFVLGEKYRGTFDSSVFFVIKRSKVLGKLQVRVPN